jgi:glutamate synthase (NADPH/NADH) small chain
LIEAERCYYCFDAPCIAACPTGIDVPSFIQRIAQGNERGAARAILEANPLGGMCARVCPTEVLCEQACVRNTNESKPVEIGALQRYATDAYLKDPGTPLFSRAADTGHRVAVVGAGPAGLACAHGLARKGHAVVVIDSNPKPGGLNEYGLATYKTAGHFAQREIEWLLSIGGIELRQDLKVGPKLTLDDLLSQFDAVFLGVGLAGVNALGIPEPAVAGLQDAVSFIAELRQSDPATVAVGRNVVVIGGGMTAVDAAVQSRLLGAERVTIVYRRGPESMSASTVEQEWAQTNGVSIRHWASPKEIISDAGTLRGVRFASTMVNEGALIETGENFTLEADMVLRAIGQNFQPEPVAHIKLKEGRIATDGDGRTSHTRVWAGGDCRHGGRDLTVEAVEHGKRAAISMDAVLSGTDHG